MADAYALIAIVNLFVLLMGVSVGRSVILLKLRREENRRRELEVELMDKRADVIERGEQVANDLEDLIYKAHVQQEIDKILRKKGTS
ncbi:MAG: hypothetical protein GF418_06035 [Chitinivibrionales bacterium]|nr:hypothetical protein [Chitinivibrionales bacterium]MBD3395171.1 hypothetical protein [Chitinivibrionales bacterium]